MVKAKKKTPSKEEVYGRVYQEVYSSCLNAENALTFVEVLGIIELVKIGVSEELKARSQAMIQASQPVGRSQSYSESRVSDYFG